METNDITSTEKFKPEIEKFLTDNNLYYEFRGWGIGTCINGVRLEWNTQTNELVVGGDNSEKDRENLIDYISEHFNDSGRTKGRKTVRFCKNPTVEDFRKLVDVITELPFEIEQPYSYKRGQVTFNREGYFYKTAQLIRYAVDNEYPHLLNRGALGFDAVDDIIIIGESVNVTETNRYREHIVPCDYIIREAVEMVREGHTDTEVAQMIKSNLAIVIITNEEADFIDNKLKLKVDMPEGWKIGDDIFARLVAGNIELK